ncbi:RNA polymerase factor sigma-54 [Solibacillus sp. FSL H8-0538]|uniref:RNA polymerase factor sigma-54 n=1 Tax=Solibacillus sp. FSL H8-0538 TaxID=2921400 RepID=UPI0030FCAC53
MELSMQLQQKQQLNLALTPQLKQSLDILSYSMNDLITHIKEQAEANPLMELEPSPLLETTLDLARIPVQGTTFAESNELPFQITANEQSLELVLMEQLAMQKQLTQLEKQVVLYFIQNLNDSGYLQCELEEVADEFTLPLTACEELLKVLQSFEPAGIGARTVQECLLLQLRNQKNIPHYTNQIIVDHLDELAGKEFDQLAAIYEISLNEVAQVLAFIQTLNPRPVYEVAPREIQYIVPDIIVESFGDEFVIRINDLYMPQISVNHYYEELLQENAQVADYLKGKLSEVLLLKKGIEQRHETLYNVTKIILDYQQAFLTEGKKALKPLRLKDVAQVTGLHESTISRTTRSKFIQTPHGTFALKIFFVRGLPTEDGTQNSVLHIKEMIKQIIAQENPLKPYSDQKITSLLVEQGIVIARRTVAKYREQLGIAQSTKREKNNSKGVY